MISWPTQQHYLQDDDLLLRPTEPADAPIMFAYIADDAEIAEYTRVPDPYLLGHSESAIEQWRDDFDAEQVMQYAITVGGGPIVGQVTLFAINQHDHNAELGFLLARHARGNSLMARSVELLCDYAFAIGFQKIYAYVDPRNVASIKTLLKAGFSQEAVLDRHMTRRDGTQGPAVMMSLWNEFDED